MKNFKWFFYFIAASGFIFLLITIWIVSLIPTRKDLTSCFTTKMYEVKLCPGSSTYTPLSQISRYMQKTVILTEDSRFYEHKGFDWASIEKSAKENLSKGKIKRGGSTITQQLAKNLYLSKDKSMVRKLAEAFITLQIEKHLTKKEILEKYLNVIEFGKDLYGIKAAARFYFDKTPAQLDVIESAFLAMLLPNPVKYSKSFKNKQLTPFAFKRVRTIIENMFQYHRIDEFEYQTAMSRLQSFLSPETSLTLEQESSDPNIDNNNDGESAEEALDVEE